MKRSTVSNMSLISLIICLANVALAGEGEVLTRDETIKLAYKYKEEDLPVEIMYRANAEARNELLEILKKRPKKANIPLVIGLLGYVGGSSEAVILDGLLDKIINSEPEKKLTRQQEHDYCAIAFALGIMRYRGISQVKNILDKRIQKTDWVSFGKRWHDDSVLANSPIPKYFPAQMFLWRYAVSQDPDLDKMLAFLKGKIEKGVDVNEAMLLTSARLKEAGAVCRRREKMGISAGAFSLIRGKRVSEAIDDPEFDVPVANVTLPESEYRKQLIKEAVAAYSQIAKVLLDDNSPQLDECMKLYDRILDDGNLCWAKRWADRKPKVIKALGKQKAILADVEKAGLDKFVKFKLKIDTEVVYQIMMPSKTGDIPPGKPVGREIVVVTFVIPDSADIFMKHIPAYGYFAAPTRDYKGNLRVYMRKTDGKWAWNPFGW